MDLERLRELQSLAESADSAHTPLTVRADELLELTHMTACIRWIAANSTVAPVIRYEMEIALAKGVLR